MSDSNILVFLFVVAFFAIPAKASYHDKVLKDTKMTLHIQDTFGGPNATSTIYAGIPGQTWSFASFGSTVVIDDPVTEGIEKNSPEIARAQGIYVVSSLHGSNLHALFSIVFSSKKYNGSTLEIQGCRNSQFSKVTEVSVVGGTGKFRFAKGFANLETIGFEILETQVINSVVRCNLTVLHY